SCATSSSRSIATRRSSATSAAVRWAWLRAHGARLSRRTPSPGELAPREAFALLLAPPPPHGAARDLARLHQLDLTRHHRREDVVVRQELHRRPEEDDLYLVPERIEAVALDRVEDAHEHESQGLGLIGHVDGVDRSVARQGRRLAARRKLLEVDREELT